MAQINYSMAIEEEGTFGETARAAWSEGGREWNNYGDREMLSTQGTILQLASYDRWQKDTDDLKEQLEALAPTAREEMTAERREALSEDLLAALEMTRKQLAGKEDLHRLHAEASSRLEINPQDFVDYVAEHTPEKSLAARKLGNRIAENESHMSLVRSNRQTANYGFWEMRCELEQTTEALRAHERAYTGNRAFQEGDLIEARQKYEESMDLWAQVFELYPEMVLSSITGSDVMVYIKQYGNVLEQLELSLGDKEIDQQFPLWIIVEKHDDEVIFFKEFEQHTRRLQQE